MSETKEKNSPSKEMVIEWVKRDITAAHYFLGVVIRYPEVMDTMGAEIYDHAQKKENGAAIDHVTK